MKTGNRNDLEQPQRPYYAAAAVVFIFLVFFLYAGWPAPDVNEAHYLAKAKHYWNPDWCRGDHFLESADAHLVFYWTFGWLTRWVSLPAAAWIGRVATWGLLAWAWQRLAYAVTPRPVLAVLSATVFLWLTVSFQMAGEWVVGGVEAKGFAYVFVLLGIEALVRGRHNRMWLLFGAASAFHVLVGGWAVVAAGFALLASREDRRAIVKSVPGLLGGLILALAGLVPVVVLTSGIDPEIVRRANSIYVFARLPHHLVLHTFSPWLIARHVGLIAAWIGLLVVMWRLSCSAENRPGRGENAESDGTHGSAGASPSRESAGEQSGAARLQRFVLGSVLVALAGAVVDAATMGRPDVAAALLRYYWFRPTDVMVPLGASLAIIAIIDRLKRCRGRLSQGCFVAAMLASTLSLGEAVYYRRLDRRPRAVSQTRPVHVRGDWRDVRPQLNTARVEYEDWRRMCRWVKENTQSDARFLTPNFQQTFKWYAGRSEVATRKDVPQDPASLTVWYRRLQ